MTGILSWSDPDLNKKNDRLFNLCDPDQAWRRGPGAWAGPGPGHCGLIVIRRASACVRTDVLESRQAARRRLPLADQIGCIGCQVGVAVDMAGGPANLQDLDTLGRAQTEMQTRVAGR